MSLSSSLRSSSLSSSLRSPSLESSLRSPLRSSRSLGSAFRSSAALSLACALTSLSLACAQVEPQAALDGSAPGTSTAAASTSAPLADASASSTSTTPGSAPTAASSARSKQAPVRGLTAEIVPVVGGLFPVSAARPDATPVPTSLVLRVHNTTSAPIMLRTGGDDQRIELEARGPGVEKVTRSAPCPEIYVFGKIDTIPANGSLDLPLRVLTSGSRCVGDSLYLTKPGLYELDVTLRAHVHDSPGAAAGKPGKGERGEEVELRAPTVHLRAG